jgi:hypothetical protein
MNCTSFNLGIPEDVVNYPQPILHQSNYNLPEADS